MIYSATSLTRTSLFNFYCRNISECEVIKTWASGLDDVAQTRMELIREYILVSEWLDEEIQRLTPPKG